MRRTPPDVPSGGSEHDASAASHGFELATYTDEADGYRLDYPTDWSVETDPAGVAFEAPGPESAGVEVFVDEVSGTLAEYVEGFFDALDGDEHVHDVERLDGRDVRLSDGQRGHVVECAYVGDAPDERWQLSYLFVRDGTTGYTVGVDWEATGDFAALASTVLESFALRTVGETNDEHDGTR